MRKHFNGLESVGEVTKKFPDVEVFKRNDLFFFPQREVFALGEYGDKALNKHTYGDDIAALQKHGFIDVISKGKRGKMTIYQFSERWKTWRGTG